MRSRICRLVFAFCIFASVLLAQDQLGHFKEQLLGASKATEMEEILKAVEKSGISTSDLLALRFDLQNELRYRIADQTRTSKERSSFAQLALHNEGRLLKELELRLAELETTAPESPETSRTAVMLAQLLDEVRGVEDTAEKRAAAAKTRSSRVKALYEKALSIETKLEQNSPNSLTLKVLLAEKYMDSAEFEEALPLFEDYLKGVELREGKNSGARLRGLYNLAQIVALARDFERLEPLKNELSLLGITYEQTMPINLRAQPNNKGADDRGGMIRLEQSSGLLLSASRPDTIKPHTEKVVLGYKDRIVRANPRVTVRSSSTSNGHPALVSVDAEGNVTDVEVLLPESPREKVIALVKKWTFRPLVYKGARTPMKGLVYCWIVD